MFLFPRNYHPPRTPEQIGQEIKQTHLRQQTRRIRDLVFQSAANDDIKNMKQHLLTFPEFSISTLLDLRDDDNWSILHVVALNASISVFDFLFETFSAATIQKLLLETDTIGAVDSNTPVHIAFQFQKSHSTTSNSAKHGLVICGKFLSLVLDTENSKSIFSNLPRIAAACGSLKLLELLNSTTFYQDVLIHSPVALVDIAEQNNEKQVCAYLRELQRTVEEPMKRKAREMFNLFDLDGSGFLDARESMAAMSTLIFSAHQQQNKLTKKNDNEEEYYSPSRIWETIEAADKNKDGKLSFEEFFDLSKRF